MEKEEFTVKTGSCCFICQREINCEAVGYAEPLVGQIAPAKVSLQDICQYLKIDLSEVFCKAVLASSLSTPSVLEQSEMNRTLCRECASRLKAFSGHFREFQLIQTKLERSLNSIHGSLADGDQHAGIPRNSEKRTLGQLETLVRGGIVSRLRNNIFDRSSMVAENADPTRVVPQSSMESSSQKLSKNSTGTDSMRRFFQAYVPVSPIPSTPSATAPDLNTRNPASDPTSSVKARSLLECIIDGDFREMDSNSSENSNIARQPSTSLNPQTSTSQKDAVAIKRPPQKDAIPIKRQMVECHICHHNVYDISEHIFNVHFMDEDPLENSEESDTPAAVVDSEMSSNPILQSPPRFSANLNPGERASGPTDTIKVGSLIDCIIDGEFRGMDFNLNPSESANTANMPSSSLIPIASSSQKEATPIQRPMVKCDICHLEVYDLMLHKFTIHDKYEDPFKTSSSSKESDIPVAVIDSIVHGGFREMQLNLSKEGMFQPPTEDCDICHDKVYDVKAHKFFYHDKHDEKTSSSEESAPSADANEYEVTSNEDSPFELVDDNLNLQATHDADAAEHPDHPIEPDMSESVPSTSTATSEDATIAKNGSRAPIPGASGMTDQSSGKAKTHTCTYPGCPVSFTDPNLLEAHIRMHAGERSYHCMWPECEMTFARNDELTMHYRRHAGSRPFQCPFCEKLISSSDYLSLQKKRQCEGF